MAEGPQVNKLRQLELQLLAVEPDPPVGRTVNHVAQLIRHGRPIATQPEPAPAIVERGNPYHGKDGKFSSGGGGGASFDDQVGAAATGQAALEAAPYNRDTEDDLTQFGSTFADTGVDGGKVGEAVYDYGNNGHASVNGALRSNGGDIHNIPETLPVTLHYSAKRVSDQVTGLDAAMHHSKLTQDVVVHRGVENPQRLFGAAANGNLSGMTFRDHGYVSTTTAGRASAEFTGNRTGIEMRILVPKGTSAISSSGLDKTELLLGRGLDFHVVHDYDVSGQRTLDVEVVR
jgi:hypothetical protein